MEAAEEQQLQQVPPNVPANEVHPVLCRLQLALKRNLATLGSKHADDTNSSAACPRLPLA